MATEEEPESLPFEVLLERVPSWGIASYLVVVVAALLTALRVLPTYALVAALLPSAVARRFTLTEAVVVVDAKGLSVGGGLQFPRSEVLDVWFDEHDDQESRVVVSGARRTLTLYFPNREQAERFTDALAPKPLRARVAGNLPELRDWASPARFLAIGIVVARDEHFALWVLTLLGVLALPGIYELAVSQRVVATDDAIEIHTPFGKRTIPRGEARDLEVRSFRRRNAVFRSPPWLGRAFDRALGPKPR